MYSNCRFVRLLLLGFSLSITQCDSSKKEIYLLYTNKPLISTNGLLT